MKAIVIDEPWISLILSGNKTWEMRKSACHHRGAVALIRKGSGMVVGTALIVDSLPPLVTAEAYAAAEPFHRIPPDRQEQARRDGWATPWVVSDARPLPRPVPYRHPYGAVIWVNLERDVVDRIREQSGAMTSDNTNPMSSAMSPQMAASAQPDEPGETRPTPPASTSLRGSEMITVNVTGGNVRNNHIYLPLSFFPADAIGGRNRPEAARKTITVQFTPGSRIDTDIDRSKRILRDCSGVRDFMARVDMKEGDTVVIRRLSAYSYAIAKG